jgi:hypothetical protein
MTGKAVEIITGRKRRRLWSVKDKLHIVAATYELGGCVRQVAASLNLLARLAALERVKVGLESDLLRRVAKLPAARPFAVARAPRLALETQVAPQQKGLGCGCDRVERPGKPRVWRGRVAQCLMQHLRHPDGGKLACPVQAGQGDGVTSVVLDALA